MAKDSDGILSLLYCVYLVVGITFTAIGGIYYVKIAHYNYLTEQNINLVPMLVIIAGAIGLLLAFLSVFIFYCSEEEDIVKHISLVAFPAILIMQITIGVYGCVQARDIDGEMLRGIQKEMRHDFLKNDVFRIYSEPLNIIQENLECCGVFGPEDYEPNPKLPASCCEDMRFNEFCENRKLRYPDGCAARVYEKVTRSIAVISNVVLGASILQVAGLICLGKICCDS